MIRRYFIAALMLLAAAALHLRAEAQTPAWRRRLPAVGMALGINPRNENTWFAEIRTEIMAISFDRGKTWPVQTAPGLLQIRQILVHPKDTNTIFCAASSALRKSTDFGDSWHTVIPGFDIDGESIVVDPLHPDTMYAGHYSGGDLYRSYDRGETWTRVSAAANQIEALALRPDNPSVLLAATGAGSIAKSSDYGSTWQIVKLPAPVTVFQEIPKIVFSPANPSVVYAAVNGDPHPTLGVWKSVDGGAHWTQTNAPHFSFWGMDADSSDQNVAYAGTYQAGVSAVYKTTDGGVTWNALAAGMPPGSYVWSVKSHPLDSGELWSAITEGGSTPRGIYRYSQRLATIHGSVNDSSSGVPVTNGFVANTATQDTVDLGPGGGTFDFGFYEGDTVISPLFNVQSYPYYLRSSHATFVPDTTIQLGFLLQPLPSASVTGVVVDSVTHLPLAATVALSKATSLGDTTLVAVTDSTGHFAFPGLTITYPPLSDYPLLSIDPEIPYAKAELHHPHLGPGGIAIAAGVTHADVFIVGAADSGRYLHYYTGACESLNISYNTWDPLRKGTAPLSRGREFRKNSVVYYTGDKHTALSAAEHDSLVAALRAGCNLFLTGQDIAEKNDSTPLMTDELGIGFAANTAIAFTTGVNGDIFDRSSFFTNGSEGADNQTSRDILRITGPRARPVVNYGAGASGLAGVRIDSTSGGGKAVVLGFGFEAITGSDVLTGTNERIVVLQRTLGYFDGSIVVGAKEPPAGRLPSEFSLEQNFPNPFNPSTIIRYGLPVDLPGYGSRAGNHVSLKIYDLLGRVVATLVDENQEPGFRSVRWNAAGVSSGVYIAVLRTRAGSRMIRMLVAR